MNEMYKFFLFVVVMGQTVVGSSQAVGKNSQGGSVTSSASPDHSVASPGVLFQGITESGITRNTFLCGDSSVSSSSVTGSNVQSSDCSIQKIQDAIGFDISGGKTIQFFNNFTYWLRQKSQVEQLYQANNPNASQADVDAYMQSNGWGSMGAYCIILSTNEILQEIVGQGKQADSGAIKVIVQLWYNGDNLIQLWSQDVAVLQPGQNFTIAISNNADTNMSTILQTFQDAQGYMSSVGKAMQPNNRNTNSYSAATDSARMVRIQVS